MLIIVNCYCQLLFFFNISSVIYVMYELPGKINSVYDYLYIYVSLLLLWSLLLLFLLHNNEVILISSQIIIINY